VQEEGGLLEKDDAQHADASQQRRELILRRADLLLKVGELDVGVLPDREPCVEETDALLREIQEETGLMALNPVPHSAFPNTYTYGGVTYETFDMVYVCGLEGALSLDGTEVDAHRWFSPAEILDVDISFPSLRSAIMLYVAECNQSVSSG
jgi:8-oxo-dGTP pyrophosphatase MutT (NUDIX family)